MATHNYAEQEGRHPLPEIMDELQEAWGEPDQRRLVRWPLHLRVGKVS